VSCIKATAAVVNFCIPRCTSDADCPGSVLHCTGSGSYPDNHCAPAIPVGAHTPCSPTLYCGPGYRCSGQTSQTRYCYKICPAGTGVTCLTTELCHKNSSGEEACLRTCDPLDSPVKCRSFETCYPDGALLKAYCIPVKGDTKTCTSTVPCVTGKICVGGACKQACDSSHPCTTGTCTKLNNGGTNLPWMACN